MEIRQRGGGFRRAFGRVRAGNGFDIHLENLVNEALIVNQALTPIFGRRLRTGLTIQFAIERRREFCGEDTRAA
ncbi:hypothetical protein [Rhodoblastus acidophilus]|uniref:hypothetical protein n=1 Tax=Rhodoblastus acidophilus TaxID=1074 RepID=UPI001AECC029|nr:hypothetical protein [Rhodoblastus acidophilus]